MDLSVGGNLRNMRAQVIKESTIPLGTVPVYEIAVDASIKKNNLLSFSYLDMLNVLEFQAKEGVDFLLSIPE